MRGKRTSDDFAKLIYRFNDANPHYANSTIARIFSIFESTLRRILKRRIGQSDRQKRSNSVKCPTSLQESGSNRLQTTVFLFWIGPHILQILTLSNICGTRERSETVYKCKTGMTLKPSHAHSLSSCIEF